MNMKPYLFGGLLTAVLACGLGLGALAKKESVKSSPILEPSHKQPRSSKVAHINRTKAAKIIQKYIIQPMVRAELRRTMFSRVRRRAATYDYLFSKTDKQGQLHFQIYRSIQTRRHAKNQRWRHAEGYINKAGVVFLRYQWSKKYQVVPTNPVGAKKFL